MNDLYFMIFASKYILELNGIDAISDTTAIIFYLMFIEPYININDSAYKYTGHET